MALTGANARAGTSAHKLTNMLLRGGLGLLLGVALAGHVVAAPPLGNEAGEAAVAALGANTTDQAGRVKVVKAYGKLPLSFEANRGQTDARVKFLSRGRGYTLYLTPTEAVLALRKSGAETQTPEFAAKVETAVLRMRLVGANPSPEVEGTDALPGKSHYFIGSDAQKWVINAPTYSRVKYRGVYPGVDLVFYGKQRQLEYDFVVAPGADPGAIGLAFADADTLTLDGEGNLVLGIADSEVILRAPVIYQEVDGIKQAIAGHYVLNGKRQVGFEVLTYDATRPLVIDPVLVYSTFLGGSGEDSAFGIAVDASGNAYVTGQTRSTNFPTGGPSPVQGAIAGGLFDAL